MRSFRLSRSCSPRRPLPAADPVAALAAELAEVTGVPIELDRPSDPTHGDYATNAALRLAAVRRRPPRELAEELAAAASGLPAVERTEVAGPGFVNLWLTDAWHGDALEAIVERGRDFGAGEPERTQLIQVEMVSANPTGPITVAAARNGAYGDSVARLLEVGGHRLEREYYFNDSCAQMEKVMALGE